MTPITEMFRSTSSKVKLLLVIVATALLYGYYVDNLSTNPSGFYLDESAGAYNAYLIATTGASEFGDLPIYPKYYTESRSEQGNPTHLYMLAAMYLFVAPSVVSARVLAASTVFLACVLLGFLANRLSGRLSIGLIVAVTALFTPWFFDASRLVLEVFTYPLAVVVFLLSLYAAQKRHRWRPRDIFFIAVGLGLVMYSYSIGRLLAPAFAFGLLLFAHNRERIFSVAKTWLAFAVTLIPYAYFTITKPGAASKRFLQVTYFSWDKSIHDNIAEFLSAYFSDFSTTFLLYDGDPLLRHHVPNFGEVLAPTLVLATVGLLIIAVKVYRNAWWLFIVYGLLVSVLPGALTTQRYHSLRLSAVPVFILLLTVPALSWLFGDRLEASDDAGTAPRNLPLVPRIAGIVVLAAVAALSIYQACDYQSAFAAIGPGRGYVFDDAYPPVFRRAVEDQSRPIYLQDGFWGPAYVHAFWYAAVQGVPRSNFIHLAESDRPPIGGLVLSSDEKCTRCEIVMRSGPYLLYRVVNRDEVREAPVVVPSAAFAGGEGSGPGQLAKPRGIAVAPDGQIVVADSGNDRIEKYDSAGNLLSVIQRSGTAQNEFKDPNGVAVVAGGSIYVTDSANHKVVKISAGGQVENEWKGPEPGFYGPRDISLGSDKKLYILDQGRARVVILDPDNGTFECFGSDGEGDGQFKGPTGIGLGGGFIFVADTGNNRIQLFNMDGSFVRKWNVPEWEGYIWHYPDVAYDEQSKLLYVTNGWKNEILAFDVNGGSRPGPKPSPAQPLSNPSGIVLAEVNGSRSLFVVNTAGASVSKIDLK